MSSFTLGGQSSGDFRETSARVSAYHIVTRQSMLTALTPDAFTQSNPPVVTTQVSTTLTTTGGKLGVLGSSIAFNRYDYGNGFIGGPVKVGGAYVATQKPLGIFINDALGNAWENTPGLASGRGPYFCGTGTTLGCRLYETKVQLGGGAGTPIVYSPGEFLYASVNGLLTNVIADAYEYNVPGQNNADFVTVMGTVVSVPDATTDQLVFNMRI